MSNLHLQSIAHFNGSNNYIEVPYKKELNPAQFTLSCWAKVEGGSGQWRSPVTCRTARGSSALGGYILYAGNNNKWQFWTGNGGWVVLQGADVVLNTWNHVAATYDGSTMKLYINGELSGSPVQSKILINSQYPLRIGAGMTEGNPTYFFNGKIAEVRLWDKARSQEQIQELMHQRLKGDEQGLVAYWPLDQESGTSAEDKTGKGNPGTLHGATWAQETLDILTPSAPETEQTLEQSVLTFNGRNNYVQIPITQWEASTFSVELWAKASKAQPGYASVISNSNTTQRGSFQIDVGGGYYRLLHSVQVQIGKLAQEWQHLAVTYDGKTVKTYLNGEESNTKAIDSMQTVFKVYKLGRNRSNNTYFAGQLSEVRIWDRARTAEEIQGGMGHRLAGDEPGLVAYFPLNKGSGKTVQDHTNPDREGTIYGATWAEETLDFLQPYTPPEEQSSEPPVLQPETLQAIASFNGSNQYIEVPYKKELNPAQFTLSCWAKVEGGQGQWRSPVTCRTAKGSSALGGYILYAGNNNKWQFWTGNGGWVTLQGADVVLNTWTHVAATYDGSTMKLYINGELSGKPVPSKILINSQYPLRIGAGVTEGNPGYFFNGKIAEVRLWDTARSQQEIQELMHQRLKGDEQGLVAYWPLNQESGTSAEDKTGKGNPGTLHGATWAQETLDILTPSAPQEEQSSEQPVLMFDGENDYIATTLDAQPSALPATTWEAWVKPTRNINRWENILSTDDQGWDRSIGTNGGQFGIYHGKEAWRPVKADIDQWQHIAVVYGADKHIKFYKNGTEYLYSGQSTIGSTQLPLHIGRSAWNPKNCFQGFITEVRVWNSARTAADIQNNMHRRLTGNEPGLVGYWPLNEGQGTTGTDKSHQGHNGTINGATWETSADLELAAAPERQTAPLNRPVLAFANTKKPTDYVILNPFNSFPAQRLTVELWLKTNHKNPGTPISYSAKSSINAFLLFDYRSLHPHVCDAKINSAIAFNDGQWHHCAMTWDSSTGKVELYKDGESVFSGTLAKGKKIPNGGALILGQEQDSVAGSFDVNQAFRGQMSEVRIWDGIRSPQEIEDNRHCALTGNESGLVLYWPLDEGTGTTVTDKSGNGHDGTIDGATWETSDLPLTSQEETLPTAKCSVLSFDGKDDYIDCGQGIDLADTNFTIECWAKRSQPNHGNIIAFHGKYGVNQGFHLGFRVQNLFTLAFWGNDLNSPSRYTDSDWHHWCGVYDLDSQQQIIYLDGKEICRRKTSPYKGVGNFYIGAANKKADGSFEGEYFFEGQLVEVRLWKTARTPEEITQNMTSRLTGSESELMAYWPMSEASGTTITDKSHQGHDGTINGASWETSDLPLTSQEETAPTESATAKSSAISFDGTDDYIAIALNEPETEVTHEFWFKTDAPNCGLFSVVNSPDWGGHDRHLYLSGGNLKTRIWSNEIISSSGLNLADNAWHHVAHVFGASIGGQKVYIDGQLVVSGTKHTSDFNWQDTIAIAYSIDAQQRYFQGQIAEVRIWKIARSADEIQQTMHQRLTGEEEGLIGYWPLTDGSGTTIADKTSQNHPGTLHGGTWTEETLDFIQPPAPQTEETSEQSALMFDGVDDYVSLPIESIPEGKEITISFWAKGGSSLPKGCSVFFAYPTPNFDPSKGKIVYTVNIHLPWSNSNIYFDCGSDGNTYNRIYKAAQATDFKDKWTHWAFTLNASTGKMAIYLNGDSWCEGNNKTLSIPQAGEVKLGSGYGFYHGSLSEVRVWDRELSATEIKDTMSTRLTGTESGLVSYWPLDEGSGTTAEDKSGNNHHGTIHGATWESSSLELSPAPTVVSAPEEPSDATSTETTLLTFDGVDDYVDIPANPTLDVTNNFTIEAWIKPEVLGTRIVDKNIGGKNEGFTFDTYPQNLRFINKGIGFTSRTPLTTGTWQHVAVTFKHEANGAKLYINGEEDNTATPSRVGTVTKLPVRLGSQADKLGSLFKGEMAEVRIWNRVRSPEEIKASMNQQLTGDEEGLIGYWPLNEGTGTTAEDKTSNGNTGTVHSGTWGTSDLSLTPAPKPESTTEETEEPLEPESTAEETEVLQQETLQSVASFDGTNDYIEVPYKKELNPTQFTVSCWAKVEGGQGQWRSPVTCRTARGSSALGGYILYAGNNNKWQFWTGNGGWVTLQGADVVLNTWTHVAATYDGSTMKLYINGELSGNPVPSKILINSQYPLRIGAGVTEGNPGYFFNGKIAEVRLWDKALSPEQIQELMHQRLKGDEQGLVAYWPLDQESGTSAEDKTGKGNLGTLHGATWVQETLDILTPSALQEEQSSEQPVLMFDGENDYIATTLDTQPSALPATTWEAWVKPTRNINHWDMILSTDDGGWDRFVGTNGGQFRVSHGKEAWNPVNADINQWQHIAVVYSADKQIKFYKNGTEYVYSGQSSIGSTKLPFHIGRSAGNASQCFQGLITEVRVWDSARTAADIQNDMHRRLTGNEPGLVGYWPLNEGQGTTGTDRSNQGHDGTINGATWESSGLQLSPAPTVEPAPEQPSESTSTEDTEMEEALSPASLMFDGIDDSVAIPNAEWETSAFSVELWAKASQNQSNYAGLFSSSNDPAASGSCQIDAMGGFYRFYHSDIQVRIAKVNQEWQHLVVTYDGQAVQTYRNGEPQNSKAVNAMNTVFRDYILGRNRNNDKYFAGELSDVRIWNKALTADEVQAAMGYRLTGDESGLVAYWPLDEGKGDAIADRTGNTPPGVMNGTTWQTTDLELSGSDEGLDASPEIPQKPQPTSKKRIPLDRSVTSITVLKSDEDFGGRPETLHGKSAKSKKRKKRKKQSKYLSPYEKYVRKVAKRQEEATHTYVERHKRSNRKKKNGWLKDFAKNYSKSVSKLF